MAAMALSGAILDTIGARIRRGPISSRWLGSDASASAAASAKRTGAVICSTQ